MLSHDFLWYNALDSALTLRSRDGFWPELKNGYEDTYNLTIELLPPLMFMMTRGIRIDTVGLKSGRDMAWEEAEEKQAELDRLAGTPLNVNSPKQCQAYFYGQLKFQPYVNRKTGSVTTDDKAMQRLVRKGCREAKLVQEIRALLKLHGTYLDATLDADGRLRCSYNPRGTVNGRLSSSKTVFGTGMNLQNLPPSFKRYCLADDGYFLMEIDKARAEWVIVAYLANDPNMIRVCEEGLDPHVFTGMLLSGLDEEIVRAEDHAVGHSTDASEIEELRASAGLDLAGAQFIPRTMSIRQFGKKSNHGLNYDESHETFSLVNEMPIPDAKRGIALYHQGYPGIRNTFHKSIQLQLRKDGTLTNCFGRKRRFLSNICQDMFREAYAFIPQSTVVDSVDMGMIKTYNNIPEAELLAQVHDSILIQLPLTILRDGRLASITASIIDYLSPEMEYNMHTFKLGNDVKVGTNWGPGGIDNPGGMREWKWEQDILLPEVIGGKSSPR